MSDFAIRFLNSEGEPITQETVDKLVCKIRENHCRSAWLALDEYGEEDFLSVDIENDWAALAFNTYGEDEEAHMYMPVNSEYGTSKEELPYSPRTDTADIRRGKLVCGGGYSGMF